MGDFLKALAGLYVLSLIVQLLEAVARLVWQLLPLVLLGFLMALMWKIGNRHQAIARRHQVTRHDLLRDLMETPSDSPAFEEVCLRWHAHVQAPHSEPASSSEVSNRAYNCCNSARTKFGDTTETRSP